MITKFEIDSLLMTDNSQSCDLAWLDGRRVSCRAISDCRNSWQKWTGCQSAGPHHRLACSTDIKETYHSTQVSSCIWECGRMSFVLTAGLVRKVAVEEVEYLMVRTE